MAGAEELAPQYATIIEELMKPAEGPVNMDERVWVTNQWSGREVFHSKCRADFKRLHPEKSYNEVRICLACNHWRRWQELAHTAPDAPLPRCPASLRI